MNRDRIVFGMQLEKSRDKRINVFKDLTLDKATQLAQAYEYFQEQLKLMGQSSTHAQAISKSRPTLTTSIGTSAEGNTHSRLLSSARQEMQQMPQLEPLYQCLPVQASGPPTLRFSEI